MARAAAAAQRQAKTTAGRKGAARREQPELIANENAAPVEEQPALDVETEQPHDEQELPFPITREDYEAAKRWIADRIAKNTTPTAEIVTITPAIAYALQGLNKGNRRRRDARVMSMAADMANNDWPITGQGIGISKEGLLNNGQHQLAACVLAQKSFNTVITWGLERRAFLFTDIHARRTASDALDIYAKEENVQDLKYTPQVAAALGWLERFNIGLPGSVALALSPARTVEMFRQHPDIVKAMPPADRVCDHHPGWPPSILAFCYYVFAQIDQDSADAFFDKLAYGTDIRSQDDPVWQLRQKISEDARNTGIGRRGSRLTQIHRIALIIKSWNAYRNGDEIRSLRYQYTKDRKEKFPVPI